jgi:hypothetical protein
MDRNTPYCTTCWIVLDVLLTKLLVVPYTALMLCFPLVRLDVLKVAVPVESSVPVPNVALPALKLTVPLGVTPVDELTDAVNTTGWPTVDGFGLELSVVTVEALFTVCVSVTDVLPAN